MALPAIHPGEHLAEDLAELDMTATQLAAALGVPTSQWRDLVSLIDAPRADH